MKKLLGLLAILLTGFLLSSCESTTEPDPGPVEKKGSILVTSAPVGAQIFLNNVLQGTTPDTIKNLATGTHSITLKLDGYRDTTVTGIVVEADLITTKHVTLTSTLSVTSFGPVRIYETAGTGVNQPSGLDLSTGNAYGVSSADKDKVDIYYSTSGTGGQGYLVQSANLNTSNGLTRITAFRVGASSNLNDGVSSPLRTNGAWTNNMDDRESNYVFLYDNDQHYSKLKIVAYGGGTSSTDPAWVDLEWLYNDLVDDVRF